MTEPLFTNYKGTALSTKAIREAVQRHRQTVGLPELANGERTHPRHWPEKERERFLAHSVESYDHAIEQARIVVALGLYCGLRRNEMRTLRVEDVDLFHKRIHVLGKGKKRRDVPLNGHVLPILEPIVRARRSGQTILLDEDGQQIAEKRINGIVSALVERTSITYKRVTPHTLRHTFGTRLYERDVDLVTIKELMGHSRIEETLRYIHIAEGSQRAAVERIIPGADIDGKEQV